MASIAELTAATPEVMPQAAQPLNYTNGNDVFSYIMKGIKETPTNGNRNNFVHTVASDCNRFAVSENDALNFLMQYQEKDFTATEIKKAVRSAYQRTEEHGTKPFTPHISRQNYHSTTTTSVTHPPAQPSQVPNDFSQFTADVLLNRNVQNIATLLTPIIPAVGLSAIAGGSDTGKSSFLRQLAIAVCMGDTSFIDFPLNTTYKRAIYVSTEDDDGAISFLLNKANQKRQVPTEAYRGLTFIFDSTNLIERLEYELTQKPADLVVIDAFSDIYGKGMNESNQVRNFLNDYSILAQKHRTAVIFLHHTGKRTEDFAPSKHNLLGSQGFEAKMRLVMELRTDLQEANKRHLCIVKGNYLPRDYKNESYVLNFDEDLNFNSTGERMFFDELKTDKKQDSKEVVYQLHDDGLTQTEIVKKLGISQPTISRWLKER